MDFPQFVSFYFFISASILILQSDGMLYQEQLNVQEMETIFSEEECIEGTLSVSEKDSDNFQTMSFVVTAPNMNEDESSENIEDKSAMSMLNALALFNDINYQYIVIGVEGPSHQKLFNVSLHLGMEEYSAKGTSIKKAQHSAARQALRSTIYNHPPKKDLLKEVKKPKQQSPVQKLENWVNKNLDSPLIYSFHEQSSKSHKNFYHDNMYTKPSLYKVTVQVGKLKFTSEGLTLDIAKQKAASNALNELNIVNGFCFLKEKCGNLWNQLFGGEAGNHSPISLIHEFASRSKQEISFKLISEEGPSHLKMFTFKCNIGVNFVSVGKGSDKKSAKMEAATVMIKKLKSYTNEIDINCNNIFQKNKKKKKNKSKLVKNVENVDSERELRYSIAEDIDPVSKLIQIQQQNNDILPVFKLVEERGKTFIEFFMQVKVGNEVYVGSGPNKKTAKRKAAEGMLKKLGYVSGSDGIKISLPENKRKEFSSRDATLRKIPVVSGINLDAEFFDDKESSDTSTNSPGKYEKIKKVDTNIKDDSVKTKNEIDMFPSDFKVPKAELNNIAQKLGFRYQFSDFPKGNNSSGFISLLSLTTDPPKVCYGTGLTTFISQDKAAEAALKNLYKYHLATISETLQELSRDTISEGTHSLDDAIFLEDSKERQ